MPETQDTTPAPLMPREQLATIAAVVAQALASASKQTDSDPALLSPEETAKYLGIGKSSLHDLDSRGFLPEPRRLGDGGRLIRWSVEELRDWIRHNCPPRSRWAALKQTGPRKAG
jgi:predicted DNA-binding transcriptional regulator AlpA